MSLSNRFPTLAFAFAILAAGLFPSISDSATTPETKAVPGRPALVLGQFDLAPLGYAEEEFFFSGIASAYKPAGDIGEDGKWRAAPSGTAPYTTRMVVVRPSDAARFNGTVWVEWLNVSGGLDSPPDWLAGHREIIRSGAAYIGVSVQKVGIDGGQSLVLGAQPLKKADPARYAPLNHPGDAYAFDIFSQAGALARGAPGHGVLGPLKPRRVLGMGESQSAVFLTTYVNAIDPLAKAYDGFLIHSRFGSAAPIDGSSMMASNHTAMPVAVHLRADLRVPVITVITETDLVGARLGGFFQARQPDSDTLRIWEIPGTAHADTYTFAVANIDSGSAPSKALAAAFAPMKTMFGMELSKPVNSAPQHHYVVCAALRSLDRWVSRKAAPPSAPRIAMTAGANPGDPPQFVLDSKGNAVGGIRTPWVDAPTAKLSGIGNGGGPLGFLVGVTEPFDQARLDALYPGGKADYLKAFAASLDSSIKAGFVLPEDRSEILAIADDMYSGK